MSQHKDNPKLIRALKDGKAPLEYLIDSVMDGDAHVMKGGADKYGIRNWIIDHIKASTYIGAIRRHLKAWSEGESIDPDSGWSHLYHIRASCAIVLDAERHGTLIDDRKRCESLNDAQEARTASVKTELNSAGAFGCNKRRQKISAWLEPVDPNAQYCVCFHDDDQDGPIYHVTYKGPFPDMWSAEEYAKLNPHNIAGFKTIHALNRP